jgi:hypothetical protein
MNFLTTLFKLNGANILKALSGAGTALLTIATIAAEIPGLPPAVTNIAGIIVGIATVLGAHGLHIATPPDTVLK